MSPSAAAATRRPVEVYVSPHGNAFMADIAAWIAEAAQESGRAARLVADGSLPGEGAAHATALIVAPHEFYELSKRSRRELVAAAQRSIPVGTEQPGTSWFERSLWWSGHAPFALDINQIGVDAASAAGRDTRLLQLGAVPSMDRRTGTDRSIDVVALAGLTDHRAERLAAIAPTLAERRCELRLFPTDRPVTASHPGAAAEAGPVFGADKYDLLADARILLNIHRDASTSYFEWARAVEAMANGCVVVTEPADAMSSLVAGEHLVVVDDPAALGDAIAELLDDPERLERIGAAAHELVTGPLALSRTLVPLLDEIESLGCSGGAGRSGGIRSIAHGRRVSASQPGSERPPRPAFRPHLPIRRRLLDAVLAERALRREIDAERCRVRFGDADHVEVTDSEAWTDAEPDVSAIVTLFDYADVVTETLDSIVASVDVTPEIVVVDDHSTDAGHQVVCDWAREHPEVPLRLIGRDANRGLAAGRNLAIEHTRTDRVMVLDADNMVYPRCLRRLSDALDGDPDAVFAWSILEVFGGDTGLLSAHAWDPARLAERNQIDAQVMFRRSALSELGGYREPPGLLLGWEDWDLWLRVVEAGGHGVLVPEILGRYRAQDGSMIGGAIRFNDVMLERFEHAHPTIDFPAR